MNEYQRYEDYSQGAQERRTGTNVGRSITFLLIGMGVGAAAALLFTPMSGSDVRNAIGSGCRRAVDGINEQTRNLRERGSSLLGFNRRKA
ncbi:MAG TPA: YtxH domain-containing protein [Candidatus Angelobacter sp.]